MTKNNTWFDAFFQVLTSYPEFKTVMTTNYKKIVLKLSFKNK